MIAKSPTYVFTRWHYLTSDGRLQGAGNETAHLDLKVAFSTNKPIRSYRVYAIVERQILGESRYTVTLASGEFADPRSFSTISARGEYDYGGLGTHYVQITAIDGSTATVYFDIPINSFRSVNINESNKNTPGQRFARSLQDTGSVSF